MAGSQGDHDLQRFVLPEARRTGKKLGVGSYGSVEELEVNGLLCAGKRLHEELLDQGDANITRNFCKECQVMVMMLHPHIVQFLGVCFLEGSTLPVLVMEQMDSSLDDLLEDAPGLPLPIKRSLLADVMRGLLYLHTRHPPIVHRDLTAKNVLLTPSLVAKIGDLGNARIVNLRPGQLARTLTRIPGTFVYMPPEAFNEGSQYGPRLDIFSFGHLALFTLTQVFPGDLLPSTYPHPDNPEEIIGRSEVERRSEYIRLLHGQLGKEHPLVELVYQCLHNVPARRPSANELLQQLETMRAQIEGPYGSQLVEVDVVKVGMVKALKVKDTEIESLQQQLEENRGTIQQRDAQIQQQAEQIQERDAEISGQWREIQTLREDKGRLQAEVGAKTTQLGRLWDELQNKAVENICLQRELQALRDETASNDESIPALQCQLQICQTPLKLKWRKGKHKMKFCGMSSYPKTAQIRNNLYVGGGGGYKPSITELCTVQVYNCESGVWDELPEYQYCYFGMVVVHGHLTLVGGRDKSKSIVTNELGLWDTTSQQWTHSYPPIITRRMRPEVAIYNNYLLAAGGNDGSRTLTTVEVLDVEANEQWLSTTPLPVPCYNMTSAILHHNWFIITDSKQVMYASLPHLCTLPQTVSNSATNKTPAQWNHLPDAPLRQSTAMAFRGSLLTIGGYHKDYHTSTAIHHFHPERNKWTKVGDLPKPRYYCAVTLLPNGEVFIAGGHDGYDYPTHTDIAAVVN